MSTVEMANLSLMLLSYDRWPAMVFMNSKKAVMAFVHYDVSLDVVYRHIYDWVPEFSDGHWELIKAYE